MAWWSSKGCWARGVDAALLNANQSLWRHLIPQSFSPSPSHLSFSASGGSECSGLHVLNRCVGIGENIKVKRKGARKTRGNSATCVSIYVRGSRGGRGRGIYLHIQVKAKREACGYLYSYSQVHVWLFAFRHRPICIPMLIVQVFALVY